METATMTPNSKAPLFLVDLVHEYEATCEEVFSAIADGGLFQITGPVPETLRMDFHEGGDWSLQWQSQGETGMGSGTFLEISPHNKVVFTWSTDGCNAPAQADTLVTIELTETNGKTRVHLLHTGFDNAESLEDHLGGWTQCLENWNPGNSPN